MAPPDSMEDLPFRETLVEQAQLSECDRIDLNLLGNIQGDTAHVAFMTYPEGEVIAMDRNFHRLPFMKHFKADDIQEQVIGGTIKEHFPEALHKKVTDAVEAMIEASHLREFVFYSDDTTATHLSVCVSTATPGDYSILGIEMEILDETEMLDITASSEELHKTLATAGHALDLCTTGREAARLVCDTVFKMIGHFERGMVYYFHEDLSGEVIHEIKKDHVESSYLGMHFPKSDIPQSARLLYVKNVVRYIKDVDGEDVPIISNHRAIDLTQTRSRSVHACHLIYLRGMGVKSAMSLAVVSKGELWGLIAFHGYTTPFKPMLHRLIAGETLASRVSARVMTHDKTVETTRTVLMGDVFRKWKPKSSVKENLEELGDQILSVMEADVLVARFTPADTEHSTVLSVSKGDKSLVPKGLFWNKLSHVVPKNGMMARSTQKQFQELGLNETNFPGSGFVFMRGEGIEFMVGRAYKARDVVWAGNPDAPKLNIGGLLHPRASFEAQVQKAKKDSHPFNTLDQKLAEMLKDLVFRAEESNGWMLGLLKKNDIKEANIRSFDALEVAEDDNKLMAALRDDLRNLDEALDTSGRRYLASPKAKSQVVFSHFATQMEPAMRVLAGPELDFELAIEAESREKTTPISIDHTEISQIVLNIVKKSIEFAGPIGRVKVNFHLEENLMDAIEATEDDVAKCTSFVCLLKDIPSQTWMRAVKDYATGVEAREDEQWFCFSATDSGNGMEQKALQEMFQHYTDARGDWAKASVDQGNLSLYACAELVRRLGGFMTCASTPVEGTSFHIGIPVASTNSVASVGQQIAISGPILLVGKGIFGLENQLLSQCKEAGLSVPIVKAQDGREALSLFSGDRHPSVVIIDYNMDGMDGLETLSKLRKIEMESDLPSAYMISCTGDVTDTMTMLLLNAGGHNEVMVKPLPEDFIPKLVPRFKVENETANGLLNQIMTADNY
uniref:histidine kinase n=1 Tax=Amphora coffeiformis TaxID=265554 RepID=A0A7S3KZ31_9STRA|mmetsp:Transcript_11912/g.24183  ORF Transcript_11912/g.24183 Transcript_11912/m.24183 type:complete len:958 (-) Transcript_11912:203-3076(-)